MFFIINSKNKLQIYDITYLYSDTKIKHVCANNKNKIKLQAQTNMSQ